MRQTEGEKQAVTSGFSGRPGKNTFSYNGVIYTSTGKEVGRGTFGHVIPFKTEDKNAMRQFIAVKFENSKFENSPYKKTRVRIYKFGRDFKEEAQWYKTFYGFGEFLGDENNITTRHYMLIPYFEGIALDDKSLSMPDFDSLLFIFIKTLSAIHDMVHAKKAVHADLKLSNLIVDSTRSVFPVDFGATDYEGTSRGRNAITERKVFSHLAPELFGEGEVEMKTTQDNYSLGKLFEKLDKRFSASFFTDDKTQNEKLKRMQSVIAKLQAENPSDRMRIPEAIAELNACFCKVLHSLGQSTITAQTKKPEPEKKQPAKVAGRAAIQAQKMPVPPLSVPVMAIVFFVAPCSLPIRLCMIVGIAVASKLLANHLEEKYCQPKVSQFKPR